MSAERRAFPTMGTMASFVVGTRDVERLGVAHIDQATAVARERLAAVDRRFSHFRADSDIVRWSCGTHVSADALAEIETILDACNRLYEDSDGVFTARDPLTGRLDTAGYVKGYAIRQAAEALLDRGLQDFIVGVGGDVHASGRATTDRPWRVAVQDPGRRFGVVALVEVEDGAVATSGHAERGDHIWGASPTSSLASFTVVGPDIAQADAYATIGFALGDAGMEWVRRHDGYRAIAVRDDGSFASDVDLVPASTTP